MFVNQLDHKVSWRDGELIRVPLRNTSLTCPQYSHIDKENRNTQSGFTCMACGYTVHADHMAAINIKAAGHAVFACGEKVLSGLWLRHEPTEVHQAAA